MFLLAGPQPLSIELTILLCSIQSSLSLEMGSSSHLSLQPILHLLLLLCSLKPTIVFSLTFPGDIDALKAVMQAVDPTSIHPASCLSSWDFSHDPCDSAFGPSAFTCGLRCDTTSADGLRRLTELALDPAGYSGRLSPAVWDLPFLDSVDLADNHLAGPIPPLPPAISAGLGRPLRRLSLSGNAFTGEIPSLSPVAPSLQELFLDHNLLSGRIPSDLSGLRSLRRLELQFNNLSGEIPDLGPLQNLYFLDASGNSLSGGFPPAGALPASLVELSLRDNRLSGDLPAPAVAGITALQVLDLSNNELYGGVPAEVFSHPSMEQLSLAGNRFEWVEPSVDGGAGSWLVAVDLARNRLGGLLPGFLGSMPRLSAVNLGENRFTGMIPAQYAARVVGAGGGGAVPFARLILSGNYLFGPIPSPMGALKEGSAVVSLADNCLFRCPAEFFFCQGAQQKPPETCRVFNPVIP